MHHKDMSFQNILCSFTQVSSLKQYPNSDSKSIHILLITPYPFTWSELSAHRHASFVDMNFPPLRSPTQQAGKGQGYPIP